MLYHQLFCKYLGQISNMLRGTVLEQYQGFLLPLDESSVGESITEFDLAKDTCAKLEPETTKVNTIIKEHEIASNPLTLGWLIKTILITSAISISIVWFIILRNKKGKEVKYQNRVKND